MLLVAALFMSTLPVVAETPADVALSGRIFQPDGTTPYQGATVRVVHQETGEVFTSLSTDANGEYWFESLDPGTYSFEVRVEEGVYQLNRAVRIGEQQTASISFTVKPEAVPGAPPADGEKKKKRGALIAIVGAGVILTGILILDDDDNDPVSTPSVP